MTKKLQTELKGFTREAKLEKTRVKTFFAKLEKQLPHSDRLPDAWIRPPIPCREFEVNLSEVDFPVFNANLAKIFRRLRSQSRFLVAYHAFSDLCLIDLEDWEIEAGWLSPYAPSNHFENMYFVAEDISFGVAALVHARPAKMFFFGAPLLSLIDGNRALWPKFWKR